MKRIITMNAMKRFVMGCGVSAPLVLLMLACQQPFKAGLGAVVDTAPPTMVLESPGAGSYIYGNQLMSGTAKDDYQLDKVEVMVTSHSGVRPDAQGNPRENELRDFHKVNLVLSKQNEGHWNYIFDTTAYFDGDIKFKFRVTDAMGKTSVTDEVAFFIKNNGPSIRMALPSISEFSLIGGAGSQRKPAPGEVGGSIDDAHLNYEVTDTLPARFERVMSSGSSIVAIISDSEGIYTGPRKSAQPPGGEFPDGVPEQFPPQYRIWEVNADPANSGIAHSYLPGYLPTVQELGWSDFSEDDETLIRMGLNDYQVSIDLGDDTYYLPSHYYGFELRVQSTDTYYSTFRYPRDYWPNEHWSDDDTAEDSQVENRYVLFNIRLPPDKPDVKLYTLDDFTRINGEDTDAADTVEGDYVYVTENPAYKSGDFTIAVTASHPDGIQAVEIYYEREDKKDRGRLIWDAPDNVSVIMKYNEWGRHDPANAAGRGYTFTYHHDSDNAVGINPARNGNFTIHRYIGPDNGWDPKKNKIKNYWAEAGTLDTDLWDPIPRLSEGTYTLEVWARSKTAVDMDSPAYFSVNIDTSSPEIEVNALEGGDEYVPTQQQLDALGEENQPHAAQVFIVNGVVKPAIIFSDSRATDSGLRTAVSDYFDLNGNKQLEQMYVLFDTNSGLKQFIDDAVMNNRKWWPLKPGSGDFNDPESTAALTSGILKHAPIVGDCLFKTSPVHATADELETDYEAAFDREMAASQELWEQPLKDGFYWLYVFNRDKAFNVGHKPVLLYVNYRSDFPVYDFTVSASSNDTVKNPGAEYDYPDDQHGTGFIVENNGVRSVRNNLKATDVIKFRIQDDDNLDLSQLQVTFVGGKMDGDAITAYSGNQYVMGNLIYDDSGNLREGVSITPYGITKRATVTISQTVLLNLLKAKAGSVTEYDALFAGGVDSYENSLPEGFYRIDFSAADHAPSKLTDNAGDAESVVSTDYFWIVVDSSKPECTDVLPDAGAYIESEQDVIISGKVFDSLGPVEAVSAKVIGPQTAAQAPEISFTKFDYIDPARKEASFEATLNMHGNSGAFTVQLQFKDRFNEPVTLSRKYTIDQKPPTIYLTMDISKFTRNEDDVWERIQHMVTAGLLPNNLSPREVLLGTDSAAGRLANGIVHFRITATDDLSGVDTIRWWLLPKDEVFPQFPTLIESYEFAPANGLRDDVTDNDLYVDSRLLADGEYCLYIMAKDKANNYTDPVNPLTGEPYSDVFFLQEEDKPWFDAASISPATRYDTHGVPVDEAVVGGTGLKIAGNIYDDDGFKNEPGTLRLWIGRKPNDGSPGDLAFEADPDLAFPSDSYTGYQGPFTVPGDQYEILGKGISLKINLKDDLYEMKNIAAPFEIPEGEWHYIIEANDSLAAKEFVHSSPPVYDSVQQRRIHNSFIYDIQPPTLIISSPDQGQTFGPNAGVPGSSGEFKVAGTIADAFLATNASGNYFIKYSLDNGFKTGEFAFGATSFTLAADNFTAEIGFYDPALEAGPHKITFSVEDKAGNTAYETLSFTKDLEPPNISFVTIDKFALPAPFPAPYDTAIGNWWVKPSGVSDQDWYMKRHEYLEEYLPAHTIITYDSGLPVLKGMIDDGETDIDTAQFKFVIDDETVPGWRQLPAAQIDSSGKNARWTLYLTGDGTANTAPLADGVHTLRISVADKAGNETGDAEKELLYVFRLISQLPTVHIATIPPQTVFGSSAGFSGSSGIVFSMNGTATSANLKDIRLKIVESVVPPPDPQSDLLISRSEPGFSSGVWDFDASIPGIVLETLAWTYQMPAGIYANLSDGSTYNIIVSAVNYADVESLEQMWTFTKDQSAALIAFSGGLKTVLKTAVNSATAPAPADDILNPLNAANKVNVLYGGDGFTEITLRGSAIDNASAIRELQVKLEQWNYASSLWTAGAWGDYSTDYNPSTPSASVYWSLSLGYLPEGLYRVQMRAKDSAWTYNGNDSDYTITNTRYNPMESDYVYFYCDCAEPTLTYKYIDNETGDELDIQPYYSLSAGTELRFTGTAQDSNELRQITVRAYPKGTDPEAAPFTVVGDRDSSNNWTASLVIPAGLTPAEGNYTLEFVAYDMAGRKMTIRRSFMVDNTPPKGSVSQPSPQQAAYTLPALPGGLSTDDFNSGKYRYSTVVTGGEPNSFNGMVADVKTGYESDVAGVWFHLGYLDDTAASGANWKDNFPTEQAIKATVVDGTLITSDSDTAFNAAADDPATAWFKLDKGATAPLGMNYDNPIIYGWNITVDGDSGDGYKYYATTGAQLKTSGPAYNGASQTKLALPVSTSWQNAEVAQSSVYSMPVWFRVSDNVGNVYYFCHDIWIFPFGDIPFTSITNPSSGGLSDATGGPINGNGIANDLNSVHSVIFRVFADNVATTVPNDDNVYDAPDIPDLANLVTTLGGVTAVAPGADELALLGDNTGHVSYYNDGWYYAELEPSSKHTPSASWNFIINDNSEITSLIHSPRGFVAASGTSAMNDTDNDTIRVWIELFVFNTTSGNYSLLNEMSFGEGVQNNFASLDYKPYVRVFYLRDSSPAFDDQQIDADDALVTMTPRGEAFTLSATLLSNDPNGLTKISIRRPADTVSSSRNWVEAWNKSSTLTGNVPGLSVSAPVEVDGYQQYTLTYQFNTRFTLAEAGATVATINNGTWKENGGRYQVDVRIWDSSSPPSEAQYTFDVGIDNFAPMADPATNNPKIAGSNVDFSGRVYDYQGERADPRPSERGLARVIAWFTKDAAGTDFRSFDSADGTPATTVMTAYKGRTATRDSTIDAMQLVTGGTPGSVTYPNPDVSANTAWVKNISPSSAGPGKGMSWSSNGGAQNDDINWLFQIDSTKLPDGVMYLNYLVVDNIGNATFYQEQLMVMNKYPIITNLTLFTSNNGGTTILNQTDDADNIDETSARNVDRKKFVLEKQDMSGGYLNSLFISKNKYVGFKVETMSGNAPLRYRLQHVTRQLLPLNQLTTLTQMVADKSDASAITLYTIADTGSLGNNWTKLGARTIKQGAHFILDSGLTGATIDPATAGAAAVYRYTQVGTLTRETPEPGKASEDGLNPPVLPNNTNDAAEAGDGFNFRGADFNAATPTSAIGEYTGASNALFLIRVWDSVDDRWQWQNDAWTWVDPASPPGGGYNKDSMLYDAVVVGMNVLLTDTTPPTVGVYDLSPYTETAVVGNNAGDSNQLDSGGHKIPNKTLSIRNALDPQGLNGIQKGRGGLYNIKTDRELVSSGHIEPSAANTFTLKNGDTRPTANDTLPDGITNASVDKVSGAIILRGWAQDDQLIDEIQVRLGTAGTPVTILKLNTDTYRLEPDAGQHAWVYDQLHWKDGHKAEWAWLWDTEQWPYTDGNPRDDVQIQVLAKDFINPQTSTAPASKTVHIVPYITGFERELPKYSTKRSLQGWYSFFEGESNITVLGYNLNPSAAALQLYDSAHSYTLTKAVTGNKLSFTVPLGAQSGKITLSTTKSAGTPTAIDAINHITDPNKSWNRESFTRTQGSELWNNRPHAHIWRSQENYTAPAAAGDNPVTVFGSDSDYGGSGDAKEPAMTLIYNGPNTGKLYGAWINDLNQTVHQSLNDPAMPRENIEAIGPYNGVDIGYWHSDTPASEDVPNYADIVYNYFGPGTNILMRDAGLTYDAFGNEKKMVPGVSSMISANDTNIASDRWKNIRTARTHKTNLTSFYDSINRRLMFSLSYYAGEAVGGYTTQYPGAAANTRAAIIDGSGATSGVTVSGTASTDAGQYNAIDYRSNPSDSTVTYPVIAYYDQAGDTVKLAWATVKETLTPFTLTPSALGQNLGNPPFAGAQAYQFTWHNLHVYDEVHIGSATATPTYYVESIGYATSTGGGTFWFDADGGMQAILREGTKDPVTGVVAWAAESTRYRGAVGNVWYLTGENSMILSCSVSGWTRRAMSSGATGDTSLFTNAGKFISMNVDTAGVIHAAFFNTAQSALVYAKATTSITGTGATSVLNVGNFTVEKVASAPAYQDVIQGITRIDLSLDNSSNPFIVYGDNSRIGSYDGARLAYKGAASDLFGAVWETVQMPAPFAVNNDRLNIEAWPPVNRTGAALGIDHPATGYVSPNWNAAIGYASDKFRIAYFNKPQYKGY